MYKIASTNAKNEKLINIAESLIPNDKTIVVSVAGCNTEDIIRISKLIKKHKIIFNHCVAEYPCKNENLRLGNIKVIKEMFKNDSRISVGYSGHEIGCDGTYASLDMDIDYLERHFCISKKSFVHHIDVSLEPNEFKNIIENYKNNNDLDKYYHNLPNKSFKSKFGMSDMEYKFLVNNVYGKDYIKGKSEL
jgi:sialic acid synthase SpsE